MIKHLIFIILIAQLFSETVVAQSSEQELAEGYYVVVGAFGQSKEDFAKRFASEINVPGKEASYGFNSGKKLFFTYVDFSLDFHESLNSMRELRKTSSFKDAWVFVCHSGLSGGQPTVAEKNKNPSTDQTGIQLPKTVQNNISGEGESSGSAPADSTVVSDTDASVSEEVEDREDEPEDQGIQVVMVLSNARNDEEVTGDVQVIDTERAMLLDAIPSGEIKMLPDPDNGTGKLTLICDVFGYRKDQKEINYSNIEENPDVKQTNDYYVIFFDLVRYHKGDIATLYNVYFFNDAAVMRPESRYEVNSLLEMMKENPNYKIKIHGHTNGRRAGKIISRGKSANFFALDEANKEGIGSAKALSRERATIIRDYLISEGIAKNRMEIKAWGGRRMLYDKNSSQAQKNVRVEIEILEE